MAKNSLECKKIMVKEISARLKSKDMLIITNYKGLTAQELNEFRKQLRGISAEYLVVKDSMAKYALGETAINKGISDLVEGEIGIIVNKEDDPSYITKALIKFQKEHEVLKIRGGVMGGALISIDEIKALASLPSRDVLLGKLANVLNAPIQGLAGALNGVISKLAYALDAVMKKKEKQ